MLLDIGTDTIDTGKNSLISWAMVDRLELPVTKLQRNIPCTGIVPGASANFSHECTFTMRFLCYDDLGKNRWVKDEHRAYVTHLPRGYDVFLGAAYFQGLLGKTTEDGNSPGWGFDQKDGKQYFHFHITPRVSSKKATKSGRCADLLHVRLPLSHRLYSSSQKNSPINESFAAMEEYANLLDREITFDDLDSDQSNWSFGEGDEVFLVSLADYFNQDSPSAVQSLAATAEKSFEFDIGSHAEKIQPLLKRYSHLFAEGLPTNSSVDRDPSLEATITLKPGVEPPKPYNKRFSPKERKLLQEEIEKLLKNGFIEESKSPWVSNVMFVKKKDTDELRFVVDFRAINAITLTEGSNHLLPNLQDLLSSLSESRYFTSLDLRSGFYQIPLSSEGMTRDLTSFRTPWNVWRFTVLPFGFKNAPGIFQRHMQSILGHLIHQNKLVCYLDDILIHSKDLQTHLDTIKEVFEIFDKNHLQMHPRKCHFLRKQISFLGHIVSEKGLQVDPKKVEAMVNLPEPRTIQELRSVLGLFNWYRKFIPSFAHHSLHLTELLKKDALMNFTEDHRREFNTLKTLITEAPILLLPSQNYPYVIHCDASDKALGAVLSQDQGSGLKPVAFLSHKFNDTQSRWQICEKETYAVIKALEEWRPFIHGSEGGVTVYTDNHACTFLMTQKEVKGRKNVNWLGTLADYGDELTIKHISGDKNRVADALSRVVSLHVGTAGTASSQKGGTTVTLISRAKPLPVSMIVESSFRQIKNDIVSSYKLVPWTTALIQWCEKGRLSSLKPTPPSPAFNVHHVVYEKNSGLLYYKPPNSLSRLIIPTCPETAQLRKEIIEEIHLALCHPGTGKTERLVKARFFWTGLQTEVIEYVRQCHWCNVSKSLNHKPYGNPCPLPVPKYPWEEVNVDICSGFPPVPDSVYPDIVYNAIIVWVDRFSKYCIIAPLVYKDGKADAAACADLFFKHVFPYFGCPKRFISDNGGQFHSAFARRLFEHFGIASQYTTSFNPSSNGNVERYNRVIIEALRTTCQQRSKDWVQCLPFVQFSINNTRNRVTNHTPAFINSGRYYHMPLLLSKQLLPPTEEVTDRGKDYVTSIVNRVKQAMAMTEANLHKAQQDMIKQMQKQRSVANFQRGDKVYLSMAPFPSISSGRGTKVHSIFYGPFEIVNMDGDNIAELNLDSNHPEWLKVPENHKRALKSSKHGNKFHVKFLRKYIHPFTTYEYPEIKALDEPQLNDDGENTFKVIYNDATRGPERLTSSELQTRYGSTVFDNLRFWFDLSPCQEWVRQAMDGENLPDGNPLGSLGKPSYQSTPSNPEPQPPSHAQHEPQNEINQMLYKRSDRVKRTPARYHD